MIIQIYEIQTPEEAEQCLAVGVNQLGSVLLSERDAASDALRSVGGIARAAGARHSVIPLFRSEESIYRALDFLRPSLVHFCENATDGSALAPDLGALIELQGRVRERFPEIEIVRTIPIPAEDLVAPQFPWQAIADRFEPVSDLFLIDSWVPAADSPVPEYVGITGRRADPQRCRALVRHCGLPVILAGGLSPENVFAALLDAAPAGADSCTLTNQVDAGGKPIRFAKDLLKVAKFVTEAERAARELEARHSG